MPKDIFADLPASYNGHGVISLGTTAAIGSAGANARVSAAGFVAHANMKILAAWKYDLQANEVTKGTATSSASYRQHLLINGGSLGTVSTATLASLNATNSAAASGTRGFTMVATPTLSKGDVCYYSQLTVGAATADGTDAAACSMQVAYQLI